MDENKRVRVGSKVVVHSQMDNGRYEGMETVVTMVNDSKFFPVEVQDLIINDGETIPLDYSEIEVIEY